MGKFQKMIDEELCHPEIGQYMDCDQSTIARHLYSMFKIENCAALHNWLDELLIYKPTDFLRRGIEKLWENLNSIKTPPTYVSTQHIRDYQWFIQ